MKQVSCRRISRGQETSKYLDRLKVAALTARLVLGLGECEVASVDLDHAILGVDPSTAGMGAGTSGLVRVLDC